MNALVNQNIYTSLKYLLASVLIGCTLTPSVWAENDTGSYTSDLEKLHQQYGWNAPAYQNSPSSSSDLSVPAGSGTDSLDLKDIPESMKPDITNDTRFSHCAMINSETEKQMCMLKAAIAATKELRQDPQIKALEEMLQKLEQP